MDPLSFFNMVYESNKTTICMPNSGIYNINQEKVNEYIERNCIKELHPILHFIFEHIQYISFDAFYLALTKYILEINTVHRNGDNNMVIKACLIIPGYNIYKSNFWISLLLKKILIDNNIANFEIVSILESVYDFSNLELDDSYIGIFPDDCAYSGQQSGDALFSQRYNMHNKLYVLIPYISNYAYAIYKNKAAYTYFGTFPKNIIFLENCINFIESFTELCVKYNFNIFKNNIYYLDEKDYHEFKNTGYCEVKSFIKDILLLPECGVLIYFDHKIADQASTIQYFLNYSTILNNVYVAENISYNFDEAFSRYIKSHNIIKNEYFSKPITILSEDFKKTAVYRLNDHIAFTFGKKYDRMTNPMTNHTNFILRTCQNNVLTDKGYYSVINNCDNKPFHEAPDEMMITLFDLNKKKDDSGNTPYICPVTYYKQKDFYIFNMPTIGGYHKKYINMKKKYLEYKSQKNLKL